jgi:membrane fusion protein, copper/silver efflux system
MKRPQIFLVTGLTLLALCGVGFVLWRANWSGGPSPSETHAHVGTGEIIYYRDPDGPFFSIAPKKNDAGKDYVAVRASEDVSFEDKPPTSEAKQASGRRIRYYRNPMGLPDTSPVPKKDAMGMDYVPVYEDESQNASTVTLSPGKMQKTGVRSEPVQRRTLPVPIRASGRIDFDPRRTAVVSLRFEGFIESVEKVAEGDYVRKGQPLMRVYGPDLSSAAAEYVAVLNSGVALQEIVRQHFNIFNRLRLHKT